MRLFFCLTLVCLAPAWGQSGGEGFVPVEFRVYPPDAEVVLVTATGRQPLGTASAPIKVPLGAARGGFDFELQRDGFRFERERCATLLKPDRSFLEQWPPPEQPRIAGTPENAIAGWLVFLRYNPGVAGSVAGVFLALGLGWWKLRGERVTAQSLEERRQSLTASSDMSDPLVGKTVGPYFIVDRIGAGGMATVYRGVPDQNLDEGRAVAVKVMQKEMAEDEEFRRRFQREVQVSKELMHPNIVLVEEWGDHNGLLFLALEFIDGQTLDRLIPSRGLDLKDAMPYLEPMLEALIYAHDKGVVHRDLKPENVMVTSAGRPKIMDFGLARSNDVSKVTRTGSALGTPAYMPPEQITGAPPTPAADQYAFGVMLYEIFTGRRPFEDSDPMAIVFKHMTEAPPGLRQFQPSLSERLEALVLRTLAKDPGQRFPSLKHVLEGLRAIAEDREWNPPPQPDAPRPSPPSPPVAVAAPAAVADEGTLAFTAPSGPAQEEGTIQFQSPSSVTEETER